MSVGIGSFSVATALLAALAAPLGAGAASVGRSYQIQTRIVEQSPGVGEFDGSLQLKISPAGIVTGYYRPADNPRFIPVSGGLTGDRFWLDIGSLSRNSRRFTGTFKNGTIDAAGTEPLFEDGRVTGLELFGTPATGRAGAARRNHAG
jgi:hypothetical protein